MPHPKKQIGKGLLNSILKQASLKGKEITIYTDFNPEKTANAWEQVLQNITNKLRIAKIPPGLEATGSTQKPELRVKGSEYITYRYFDEQKRLKTSTYSKLLKHTKKLGESHWPNNDPISTIQVTPQLEQTQPTDILAIAEIVNKTNKTLYNQL